MKTMTRRPVPDNNLIKSVRKLGPLCGLSGPALVIVLLFSWFLASCGTVSKQSQPLPPDFGLSTSPGTLTIAQGSNGSSTITVAPQNGFTGNVTLRSEEHTSELQSLTNLVCRLLLPRPPMSSLFPYTTLFRSLVIVLLFSWFLASCGTVSKQSQPLPPDFGLSTSPGTLTIAQGSNGSSTITVAPQNGFTGNVTLAASGLPNGVTASFSTNPTTPTSTMSTLTLTASSTAATGMSTIGSTGA